MYLVKTPWLLKKFYPQNLIWNKSRDKKIIYLTFDDGPIPIVTPFVLEILKKFNAKATFFCIGDNINKHQDIFFQLKADGHAIGNHTYNHLNGWKSNNKKYLDNIIKCQELTQTNLFRPPYGRIKKSQIKNLESKFKNHKIIMWDVLSGDFDTQLAPEKCLKNVCKNAINGSIVVFHDSLKAFDRLKYTLPKALEFWQSKGYEFHQIH
ncbi:peptidoglycan-N-acetylglucosamine deacetylase [Pedobacter glucosidilyticus]|nr:polysaccharide deacetylase family protein [Pedobacter glucosidilyticus]KHJ36936.1 peptidoglycan-N-acetylglucosamine deacetylase [Pedobacter glucosidilyticus]